MTATLPSLAKVKLKARRGKILFINPVNEVTRERAQRFLTDEHLQRVVRAYQGFKDEPGFTRVVPMEEIRAKDGQSEHPAVCRWGNAGTNECCHRNSGERAAGGAGGLALFSAPT